MKTIYLDKNIYHFLGTDKYPKGCKSLSDVLEYLDPSLNYVGTSLEGLDAFSRQLKRFDIKVSGPNSDTIDKFFQSQESAVLFPEYVRLAVKQGMDEVNILSNIVATTTEVDGMAYRSITSNLSDTDEELTNINEGATIPQIVVKTNENLVKLHKRGRMLVSSYEALRFQRIDLFTITLKQIGAYIARAQLKDAIDTIVNGDGNNSACSFILPATGELSYNHLISMYNKLSPFELDTILVPISAMGELLALPELAGSVAKATLQNNTIITPLGAKIIPTSVLKGRAFIGLDSKCALEMTRAADITVDYTKLINRQFERATITAIAGFTKIFNGASVELNY